MRYLLQNLVIFSGKRLQQLVMPTQKHAVLLKDGLNWLFQAVLQNLSRIHGLIILLGSETVGVLTLRLKPSGKECRENQKTK